MNIYFLPTGENDFQDRLFEAQGGSFWRLLVEKGKDRGMVFHTVDLFDPKNAREDDVFAVLDHPEESPIWRLAYLLKHWRTQGGFFWKKRKLFYHYRNYFHRKVLLQGSPPVISVAYRNLPELRRMYTDICLMIDGFGPEFHYLHYAYDSDYRASDMIKKYFREPRDKFLVMIASNCMPHLMDGELYGERIRAIKFWGKFPDFDLYGLRWNSAPKHPAYMFDGAAMRRPWRGVSKNRWADMSHYKFALVFEAGCYPGWITEKIFDCFVAGAVPVYLGAPDIKKYIPEDCFINIPDFPSYEALNTFLRHLADRDIEKYHSAILEFFATGKDRPFTKEPLAEQILDVLAGKKTP